MDGDKTSEGGRKIQTPRGKTDVDGPGRDGQYYLHRLYTI